MVPVRHATRLLAVAVLACGAAGCAGGDDGARPLPVGGTAPVPATWPALLERHAPVLRYDRRDRSRATGVEAFVRTATLEDADGRELAAGLSADRLGAQRPGGGPSRPDDRLDAPSAERERGPDVVHGRVTRGSDGRLWLQYWLFLADNPQDRGILRTGRHEGDWELVQVGLGGDGRPGALTLTQHSWEEACGWDAVRREGDRPVVAVANGSHALYRTTGTHGRPWPDPEDEARGDGRTARPRVTVLGHLEPRWLAWPGRWGGSVAGIVPGESDSPRGPAFQPGRRWTDPEGLHRRARACGSGAAPRPLAASAGLAATVAMLILMPFAVVLRRRRRPAAR